MDALCDACIETVVIMSSSQIGKTEILNNVVGYYIDQDPSPMLMVQPTLEMGRAWSKDRFMPMLRDTPCLQGKVKDARSKDSTNTILHKVFPGGHLTASGANSAASLASRPVRIVLCDEVDRYPISAGAEGDPVNLAFRRAATFWNRKRVLTSTPTVKDLSRIEAAYEASDKRKYYVPCPSCGGFQVLVWGQVKWPKSTPKEAYYECAHCKKELYDADKLRMVSQGKWRATEKFNGTAGFWINELYSPWSTFGQIAQHFYEAKKSPETLKVFVNTVLGNTWEEGGEVIDDGTLLGRRERYGPKIPMAAGVITAGVDVQQDRLEVEVVAWGKGEESWSVEYKALHGEPAKPELWKELEEFLAKIYTHESGIPLRIAAVCVDTGFYSQQVYAFVKPLQVRRVFAIKGQPHPGKPLVGRPSQNNSLRVKLFPLGVDTAKDLIYARLKMDEFGPGYMHFPVEYDAEYFKQLTAEKAVTKFNKGFPYRVWQKIRARNEALDCRVYALAALTILDARLDKIVDNLKGKAEEMEKNDEEKENAPEAEKVQTRSQILKRAPRQGFVNKWRQ